MAEMKVRIDKKSNEGMEFLVEGVTPAFANALRRIMVSKVPTMAIEWVDVSENNSVLFDEMLAHRLGLIPLKFDPEKFNFTEDCKCDGKGCPSCQVVLVVEKTGPSMVYSGDMKSSNKDVKPTSPSFPIVELLENQSLRFEATARLGTGESHAKFQAANATYSYYPEERSDKPQGFMFRVETVSGLEPAYIVSKSAEILRGEAEGFKKELKSV